MRTRRCMSRVVDEGALTCTALAASPVDRFLATGSDAGFVNIYHQHDVVQVEHPTSSRHRKPALVCFLNTQPTNLLPFKSSGMLGRISLNRRTALPLESFHHSSTLIFGICMANRPCVWHHTCSLNWSYILIAFGVRILGSSNPMGWFGAYQLSKFQICLIWASSLSRHRLSFGFHALCGLLSAGWHGLNSNSSTVLFSTTSQDIYKSPYSSGLTRLQPRRAGQTKSLQNPYDCHCDLQLVIFLVIRS